MISESMRLDVDCLVRPQNSEAPILSQGRFQRFLPGLWSTPLCFVLTDMAMVMCSVLFVHFICELLHITFRFSSHIALMPPLVLAAPLAYAVSGLYPGVALNPVHESRRVCMSVGVFYLVFLASSAIFLPFAQTPIRVILMVTGALNLLLAPLGRTALRAMISKSEWWGMPTIIFGHGGGARRIFRTLHQNRKSGLRPCAIVDVRDPVLVLQDQDPPAPVYGLQAAPFLAKQHRFCYAVLAMDELNEQECSTIINQYADAFGHLMVMQDLDRIPNLWIATREIGGKPMLELSQPLAMRTSQLAKRTIDLLICVFVLVATAPLFVTLYLLVRLTSAGPAFYGHSRIGRYQKPFRAWKFRTMVQNADLALQQYLSKHPELRAEWDRDQKLKDDPRVTFVGRFLRKLSLDELPQIWNVLLGEMSIVGPRPIVTAEVARYGDRYSFYQKVRPGITGLWQVSGRNNTTYDERTAYDEYYVRNWSAWLDIYILFRTIKAVLFAEGAY